MGDGDGIERRGVEGLVLASMLVGQDGWEDAERARFTTRLFVCSRSDSFQRWTGLFFFDFFVLAKKKGVSGSGSGSGGCPCVGRRLAAEGEGEDEDEDEDSRFRLSGARQAVMRGIALYLLTSSAERISDC